MSKITRCIHFVTFDYFFCITHWMFIICSLFDNIIYPWLNYLTNLSLFVLIWMTFNHKMDIPLQPIQNMALNYLSIHKFIKHIVVHVIARPCWDFSWAMSVKVPQGWDSILICRLINTWNPTVFIKRPYGCLISTMGIPTLVIWYLYMESATISVDLSVHVSYCTATF